MCWWWRQGDGSLVLAVVEAWLVGILFVYVPCQREKKKKEMSDVHSPAS